MPIRGTRTDDWTEQVTVDLGLGIRTEPCCPEALGRIPDEYLFQLDSQAVDPRSRAHVGISYVLSGLGLPKGSP